MYKIRINFKTRTKIPQNTLEILILRTIRVYDGYDIDMLVES